MIFVLLILVVLSLSIAIDSYRYGISPMPSSHKAIRVIFSKIQGGRVYDLGSGWGNLAFALAKNKKIKMTGFESSFFPWFFARLFAICFQSSVDFRRRNFLNESLKDADVVVCYLYPGAMHLLREKFTKELKPDSFVISNTFAIAGWKPDEVIEVGDWMRSKIYLYDMKKVYSSI